MPKAYLIDGTAFCYRAFYAIRSLSTADGRPTNAVYGFVVMLKALREKQRPDYAAVAFDAGKPTFRHRKFEAYKVQRKPMPESLIGQLPAVKRLLAAYRLPIFELEGFEAEDLLATIATRTAAAGIDTYLVTGDKDALQLVNGHIKVYNPHKEDGLVMDAAAVEARYGVAPDRMVELMALMGDEIDNIPGVPGIGEKTAMHLLQQFGSLEELYRRLEEVESPVLRQSLDASREQVALSRELAQIDQHVPLDVSLDALKIQEPDWRALRAIFREMEFKKLLRELEAHAPTQMSNTLATIHVVTSPNELTALKARLAHATEATALLLWPSTPEAEGFIALAPAAAEAWVIPLDDISELAGWLSDPQAKKISHDAKAAKRALAARGVALHGLLGDTMLAAYLLNPARTRQALSDVADELLEQSLPHLPKSPGIDQEPFGRWAIAARELHAVLESKLQAHHLDGLYHDLELPLLDVLTRMEADGVAVDVTYLRGLHARMDAQLTQLTEEIYRLAGTTFNLNSPKQLAGVLFERLQLPVIKRTKTGPSTDSDVLQRLAGQHPLPEQLMQFRELSKLVSTYVEALPKLVDPLTGRIHPTFNQTVTATGRLSCSEPNLQNIPVKTELGRSIRRAFIAGIPDGALLAADYSQIELRILAHLSGDAHLTEAFRQHRDIHRFTASLIYGCSEAEVQPQQRSAMKAVNFGIIYGMSAHGLSKELGIGVEEAQAFIEAYFERYPKVRDYLQSQIECAKRDGFVQTLLGRRRYIPEVKSPDGLMRQFGERMAINAPIQGSAADLIKQAMVEIDLALRAGGFRSRMVLQVHDELVFEAPQAELARLGSLVRDTMEHAMTLTVPLTVTLNAGPNWLELTPVE
ncbi:MAG: DNA polymerase I [Candidatus Omnitrophica bacterium]|nr:DNA polymerase I [Candidatus Omnitrophota bacterium]